MRLHKLIIFNPIYLVLFTVIFFSSCKKEKNINNSFYVYHSLTLNGHNYGFRDTLPQPLDISWSAKLTNSNILEIHLPYINPGETTIYNWIIIYVENPSLGNNDATLTKAGGCITLNSAGNNFKINFSKLASGSGDFYEGTFSGNVELINLCGGVTINSYSSSGGFKVYRE